MINLNKKKAAIVGDRKGLFFLCSLTMFIYTPPQKIYMYKISTKLIPSKMDDKRREKILKEIKSYRAPDAIIAYLFALLETEILPTDDNVLHTAISKLKEEYPDFFEDFIFSRGDIYPFSKELERILFRFQQSGILGAMNPTLEFFIFPEKSKKIVLEHLSDKFSQEEKKVLSEASKKLESLLAI